MKDDKNIKNDLKAALRANLRDELKAELEGAEAEINSAKPNESKVFPMYRWLAVAAGVALIVLAGMWSLSQGGQDSSDIFAAYFEPFDNVVFPIKRSKPTEVKPSATRDAYAFYESGDYKNAIIAFNGLQDFIGVDLDKRLYLAVSYLADDKAENALPILENLTREKDFRFVQQAQWYLGLGYLQAERMEDAKRVFQEINAQKSPHPYQFEAVKILQELE